MLQATDPCEKARAVIVPRAAMQCRSVVQEGTFGRVYRGALSQASREQEVIIKTVTGIHTLFYAYHIVYEILQVYDVTINAYHTYNIMLSGRINLTFGVIHVISAVWQFSTQLGLTPARL